VNDSPLGGYRSHHRHGEQQVVCIVSFIVEQQPADSVWYVLLHRCGQRA